MTRLKFILTRGLAVAVGIAMAAFVAEVMLRAMGYSPIHVNPLGAFHEGHPLVGYRGKPNFSGRFRRADFDVVIAHDQNGIRTLDLLPHFLEAKKTDRFSRLTFQRDKHWSEKGHAVVAKTLSDFILALDDRR